MNLVFDMLTKLWCLWLFIIVAAIIEIFRPKIKDYLGEKSGELILSSLNENKYKLINNIMLSLGNKTTQIDPVIVSN